MTPQEAGDFVGDIICEANRRHWETFDRDTHSLTDEQLEALREVELPIPVDVGMCYWSVDFEAREIAVVPPIPDAEGPWMRRMVRKRPGRRTCPNEGGEMLQGYAPLCPTCEAPLEPVVEHGGAYRCIACDWPYWVLVTSESGSSVVLETIEPEGGSAMSLLRSTRRSCYALARVLGDLSALLSGSPKKLLKRGVNKWLGRNIGRRLWRR